jgi:hypothetical protein
MPQVKLYPVRARGEQHFANGAERHKSKPERSCSGAYHSFGQIRAAYTQWARERQWHEYARALFVLGFRAPLALGFKFRTRVETQFTGAPGVSLSSRCARKLA